MARVEFSVFLRDAAVRLGPNGTYVALSRCAPEARKRGSEQWTEKGVLKKSTLGGFWIGIG